MPIGGWPRVVAVALGAFVVVATEFAPTALLPSVAETMDVPVSATGTMTVVPGVLAAIVAPLAATVPSRVDRRALVAAAVGAAVAGNVAVAVAPSFAAVVAGRIGAGVALGVFWTVGAATAVRLVGDEHSVRAVSTVSAGTSLGIVVGMPVGSLAPPGPDGWRVVFAGLAVAAAAVSVLLLVVLPPLRGGAGTRSRGGARSRGAGAPVWSRPAVRRGLLTAFAVFTGQFTASTFLGAFAGWVIPDPALVTAVLAVFGAVGLAGVAVASFGLQRRPAATVAVAIGLLGGVLALTALAVAARAPATVVIVLLLAWGAVWGTVPFGTQTWMLLRAPDRRESVSAALVVAIQAGIGAGSALGSVVLGVVERGAAEVGSAQYAVVFAVAAAVCLVAAIAFGSGVRPRRRP